MSLEVPRKTGDPLTSEVIRCAIEVHRELGPGLLESVYEQCLAHELTLAGISFKLQEPIPVQYKGVNLNCEFRIDLLVEDRLIVELKTVAALQPIHDALLLTYLRLAHRRTGLLINFNVSLLKDGLKRMVL